MDRTTFTNKIREIRNDLRKVREAFEEDYIVSVANTLFTILDSIESNALECDYGDVAEYVSYFTSYLDALMDLIFTPFPEQAKTYVEILGRSYKELIEAVREYYTQNCKR
jgi:hypothetical protein